MRKTLKNTWTALSEEKAFKIKKENISVITPKLLGSLCVVRATSFVNLL